MQEAITHGAHLAAESHGDRYNTCLPSHPWADYHCPETLIPLTLVIILRGKPISVYGDGQMLRDRLPVEDHCRALDRILSQGEPGSTYCIGGRNAVANIDLVTMLCALMDELAPQHGVQLPVRPSRELITYVSNRPGHGRRYAIDSSKI